MIKICYYLFTVWSILLITIGFGQRIKNSPVTESYGGRLIIGTLTDGKFDLNPFEIHSALEEEITQLIYGYGLTKTPDKFANPPDLISRYIMDGDAKSWRMVLKRNITFHNDIDLRNSDVKFTFELIKKFGGFNLSRKFDFSNIKSISTSGDLEIVFELFREDKTFNEKLADIPIISERHYGSAFREGYSVFSKKIPNGMGPFVFEFQTENVLSLVFHSDYYSGRPFLNEVKIQFFAMKERW